MEFPYPVFREMNNFHPERPSQHHILERKVQESEFPFSRTTDGSYIVFIWVGEINCAKASCVPGLVQGSLLKDDSWWGFGG